jgi:prolipoprotein diacylglyceryl transferase
VTGLSLLPLSIPSPPPEWQIPITIPIGQWFHWLIPVLPANQIIPIHSYALCILAGIIAAVWLTNRRLKARGGEPGIVLDVILWAVPIGLVGARAWHVATHVNDYFFAGAQPWNIFHAGNVFAIWEGGNAIFGALLGGAIGAYIGCRLAGLRFWAFADALAPAMLIAQALGRLGNYFNHELFGLPTDLPWGLQIEATNSAFPVGLPADTLFHPTFLYEMLWNIFGIFLILRLEKMYKLQWGKVWAAYLIWYGIGRVWFESIRIDPSEVFLGLRSNVWGAILAIALGIILWVVQTRRHPGVEPGLYLPGREWVPADAAVDSGETYSDSDEPGDGAEPSVVAANSGEHATSVKGTKSS